jgi:cell division protein FtsB
VSVRTWAALSVLAVMAAVAVQGGEYSTGDYLELKRRLAAERAAEARLTAFVDSLIREEKAVRTDPRVQERIAREQWGMIRPGERIYKLTRPQEP